MSNERDLLGILKSNNSLLHKYDEDAEYHRVVYHILLCCFIPFRKRDYINSEYK